MALHLEQERQRRNAFAVREADRLRAQMERDARRAQERADREAKAEEKRKQQEDKKRCPCVCLSVVACLSREHHTLMYADRPCQTVVACTGCWSEASKRQGAVSLSHAEAARLSHLSTALFW